MICYPAEAKFIKQTVCADEFVIEIDDSIVNDDIIIANRVGIDLVTECTNVIVLTEEPTNYFKHSLIFAIGCLCCYLIYYNVGN